MSSSSDSYPIGDEAKPKSSLSSFLHKAQEKLPAFSGLQHELRQQAVRINPSQNSETLQLQLTVKALSGVVQDEKALAREEQIFSKQLYTWSKEQGEKGADIVDIGDRLAFLVFKRSELELEAAAKIEQSRSLLKDIRNMENGLVPRRRNAVALANKIATLRKENKKNSEEQMNTLSAELSQLENENSTFEASFSTLLRTKLHESFSLQFAAQQELGEKQAIVARYGALLLQGMEGNGIGAGYKGDHSARVKVELEQALANYSPSPIPRLDDVGGSSFLDCSDTRSFGETHSSQLSQLDGNNGPVFSSNDASNLSTAQGRAVPPIPTHPQAPQDPFHDSHVSSTAPSAGLGTPPPLPARTSQVSPLPAISPIPAPAAASEDFHINLSPTARPTDLTSAATPPHEVYIPSPPPGAENFGLAPKEPTVAETGEPIIGTGGPSSGQLRPRTSSLSQQQQQQQKQKASTFDAAGWGGNHPDNSGMPGGFGSSGAFGFETSSSNLNRNSTISGGGGPEGEDLPAYGDGDEEAQAARDRAEQILAEERERKSGRA